MASALALLNRSLVRQGVLARSVVASPLLARFQSTKTVDGRTQWVGLTNDQDFFKKNDKLNRPMSPHLTIYRFPLPAILSISHRVSGAALTMAISAAAIGLMVHPLSFYIDAVQAMQLPAACFFTTKTLLAFPFTYHTVNGLRHLFWDTAKGLELGPVYSSGYMMVGLGLVSAVGLAML